MCWFFSAENKWTSLDSFVNLYKIVLSQVGWVLKGLCNLVECICCYCKLGCWFFHSWNSACWEITDLEGPCRLMGLIMRLVAVFKLSEFCRARGLILFCEANVQAVSAGFFLCVCEHVLWHIFNFHNRNQWLAICSGQLSCHSDWFSVTWCTLVRFNCIKTPGWQWSKGRSRWGYQED